ncbi:hypothetical protein B0H15DRAFT_947486 [Mycena belliarum]|uniref:Uncharacterized protein n=1 Tax=Mycena belliarum TaxID=1033014 RepID=A0AAD6U7X2_9AGAR|nr:hypothetical protein B0H15DRAFT_947486 [Mycena belliae]
MSNCVTDRVTIFFCQRTPFVSLSSPSSTALLRPGADACASCVRHEGTSSDLIGGIPHLIAYIPPSSRPLLHTEEGPAMHTVSSAAHQLYAYRSSPRHCLKTSPTLSAPRLSIKPTPAPPCRSRHPSSPRRCLKTSPTLSAPRLSIKPTPAPRCRSRHPRALSPRKHAAPLNVLLTCDLSAPGEHASTLHVYLRCATGTQEISGIAASTAFCLRTV